MLALLSNVSRRRRSVSIRASPGALRDVISMNHFAGLIACVACVVGAPAGFAAELDRTVLPIPEPEVPSYTELDARNAKPPPRFEVKAPQGAPNVVIVLLDDIGFGQSSTFGGPARMPALDALATQGIRYNNFHTTALCSPTRTALADRPQSSREQRRRDHGTGDRVSGQHRHPLASGRAARRRCCG